MPTKHALRRTLLQRRATLPSEQWGAWSSAICQQVQRLPVYQRAHIIHCYLPIRAEVDTLPLAHHALTAGKRLVVPIVEQGRPDLAHSWISGIAAAELEPGTFGILQPRSMQPAALVIGI
ncbi:MAG: hypothetical protein HC914_18480 [Chloroflexaceae bacterium]|nr:hypothetical protein [Chloroflexaceae bacterium]